MNKNAYWRKREEEQLKHYISEETELQRIMAERYSYMLRQIQVQINDFYARYARREQITLAEAMQRVSKMDVQAFGAKAKKYVEEKDFTPKANQELRLYNATMRINRLELLKANIGLEMIDGFNDLEKELDQGLTKRTEDELKRQEDILRREAGILNTTVFDNAKTVQTIVNASFNNATWSERIWGNQTQLKNELSSLLTQGLIQGRNPLMLAPAIERLFGVSRRAAERLMVTEMARVQTDAQMESYKRNDIDQYVFISVDTACKECMALNNNHYPVKDMMPGENAPPIHPNCRCSTAAYIDREALERGLFAEKEFSRGLKWIDDSYGSYYGGGSFRHAYFKTAGISPKEYFLKKKSDKAETNIEKRRILNKRLSDGTLKNTIRWEKQKDHLPNTKERGRRLERDGDTPSSVFNEGIDIEKLIKTEGYNEVIEIMETKIARYFSVDYEVGQVYNIGKEKMQSVRRVKVEYTRRGIHTYPVKDW